MSAARLHDRVPGLGRLVAGALVGAALGLVASLLFVALDPNLRPVFALSLARSAPRMVAAFGAAGALVAAIGMGLGEGALARGLRRALAALLPALGLAVAALASPSTPWTLEPRAAGALVTRSEALFLLAFAALAALLALPLARRLGAPPAKSGSRAPAARWLPTALAALAVAAVLVVPRSGGGSATVGASATDAVRRVVLIGIDGADWAEIDPLLERGELPALADLVETGARGPLTTYRPTLSPMIWTTVATGQPPARHGILDFRESGTNVPYTSNSRRVPALWNLLGERGVPVAVVGWFVTWPAEAVNGHLVSSYSANRAGTIKGTLHADLARQTHPPGLFEALLPLVERGGARGRAAIASLLEGYPPPPRDGGFGERVRIGGWVLGADRTFADAAAHVLRDASPRFVAVYFSAIDAVGHLFCHSNPWRDEICGTVLAGAYAAVDRHVRAVLDAVGPGATVLIVSDHGFDRTAGHDGRGLHGPPGIAILSGPGIAAGARIRAASIYDVVPTVLALFGLPIPDDLRGRPLLSAFEPTPRERVALRFGPPLPRLDPDDPALRPIPAASDRDYEERLRALGYIE